MTELSMKNRRTQDLTDVIGRFGPFQWSVLAFAMATNMSLFFHVFMVTALAPKVDHWCSRPTRFQNLSVRQWKGLAIPEETRGGEVRYESCRMFRLPYRNETFECSSWEYDNLYEATIVEEWDLVCSRNWLISLSESVFMFGYMTSMIAFGHVSDRFGRRTSILLALSVLLLAESLSMFSVNFIMLIVLRFFVAAGSSGASTTALVLLTEVVGPQMRLLCGVLYWSGGTTGILVLALVAYYVRGYPYVMMTAMTATLLLISGCWTLTESPRWLLAKRKFKSARQTIEGAAQKNHKKKKKTEQRFLDLIENIEKEQPTQDIEKPAVFSLLTSPVLRRRTLMCTLYWFATSFTYYGIMLHTNDLGGNPYLNLAISGVVEYVACIVAVVVTKLFGRRFSLCGCMVLAGLICLLNMVLLQHELWLKNTLAMVSKFLVTTTHIILYVYVAEIFPTPVRGIGVGVCSAFGRIGSIISPFVKELAQATSEGAPLGIYGTVCAFSGLLILASPETESEQLLDNLFIGEPCNVNSVATEREREREEPEGKSERFHYESA